MQARPKSFWVVLAFTLCFFFACVTINIYFPAEKVESVAGEIVQDIRGGEPAEKPQTEPEKRSFFPGRTLVALLDASAWAAEETTVSNPTIRALKEQMKKRFTLLKPYYQKGLLQEGDNGYVAPGNIAGLGLKDKRDLNSLMDAENADRQRLYQEVAAALKIDASQLNRIETIFAKEWQQSLH